MAGQIGESVIALPMGSGLCLGRLYGFPDDLDEPVVYSFAVDRRHGWRTDAVQERPREQFIKNRRLQMVIRTFIDYRRWLRLTRIHVYRCVDCWHRFHGIGRLS